MKIKITNKKCGLEVGKEYDLCPTAAKGLIAKRQAVEAVEIVKPVVEKTTKKEKPVVNPKGKTDESQTK